jgi:serine protease Do
MRWKWSISIAITVLIWGIGIAGIVYVKGEIPEKITKQSAIYQPTKKVDKSKQENVPLELKEIIRTVQKLVVKIELPNGSIGSGFLYNDKGDVITNAHVAANAKEVKIKTADAKEFTGKVIGISKETDIALIRVKGLEGLEPLKMATRKMEIGDEVLALGNPLGLENTVTTGIISGVERDFDITPFHYDDVYQISAPIARGNSGGPLIDGKTGEVLGVNSAVINEGVIGFSIPIQSVLPLVEGWSKSPMAYEELPEIVMEGGAGNGGGEDAPSDLELSKYLILYFYDCINYSDYVTAYSLLGNRWQTNTSYETFREGYSQTHSVTVDDLTAKQNGENIDIVGIISAIEYTNGGGSTLRKYIIKYQLHWENQQLKIINGKLEEV